MATASRILGISIIFIINIVGIFLFFIYKKKRSDKGSEPKIVKRERIELDK